MDLVSQISHHVAFALNFFTSSVSYHAIRITATTSSAFNTRTGKGNRHGGEGKGEGEMGQRMYRS